MEQAKDFSKKLNNLINFNDQDDINEFKQELIQLEIMDIVQLLLVQNNISRIEFANYLNLTKEELTDLFTVDKPLDILICYRIMKFIIKQFY